MKKVIKTISLVLFLFTIPVLSNACSGTIYVCHYDYVDAINDMVNNCPPGSVMNLRQILCD